MTYFDTQTCTFWRQICKFKMSYNFGTVKNKQQFESLRKYNKRKRKKNM